MQPTPPAERIAAIDALRGAALFGVLMVNLLTLFRVSLFQHILRPESDIVGTLSAVLLEFKAVALFSFLFGVGLGIQSGRVADRTLVRRMLVLFVIGLVHMLLVWNGDILTLYALCGLLATPLLAFGSRVLVPLAAAAILLPYFISLPIPFPGPEALRNHADAATRVYATGGYAEIAAFRWVETRALIAPLLLMTAPKTFGLILCGVAAWRSGVLLRREILTRIVVVAGLLGPFAAIPLAFAYGAAALLWMPAWLTRQLAPLGRMALTNYLSESVVLSFIFYGYGLGLIGKLSNARAGLIGVALYAAQIWTSRWWLHRYRFGPAEWLWRSATYGRWQPMRRLQ